MFMLNLKHCKRNFQEWLQNYEKSFFPEHSPAGDVYEIIGEKNILCLVQMV